MKRTIPRLAGLIVAAVVIGAVPVFARSSGTMTDDHVARIRTNCHLALATLSQIHANDAPVYVNRNQTYYSISAKLMTRLNSRLSLNGYDTTELSKTAATYNSDLADFRSAYKQYDNLMDDVVRIDCTKEPVGFYDKVADARAAREAVNDAVAKLTDDINRYRSQVGDFESRYFALPGEKKS